jgi:hypothetical protein
MTRTKGARPFYEQRWFQGTAAVLGLVAVVFSLIGPPNLWDAIANLFSDELPPSDTQYVVDASAAMGAPFGSGEGETKLSAAAETIAAAVVSLESEGLALRRFGGSCEDSGDLLVAFGDGHADDVGEAAREQSPEGASNLVNAVVAAIDDFNDGDRFPSDREFVKRIVVVAGTSDACFEEDAAEMIRRRLEQADIVLDFTFVGVAVPEDERDRLREVAGDLEAPVIFADTDEELGRAVEYLELEPALADSQAVQEIHNAVIESLNLFITRLNAGQFDEAATALGESNEEFAGTESRFASIGARLTRPEVVAVHSLVGRAREIQEELIARGQTLLEVARSLEDGEPRAEYDNALAEWNGVIRRQRDNVAEIDQATGELADRVPPIEG